MLLVSVLQSKETGEQQKQRAALGGRRSKNQRLGYRQFFVSCTIESGRVIWSFSTQVGVVSEEATRI